MMISRRVKVRLLCEVLLMPPPLPHHHRRLVTGSRHQRWRGDLPSAGDTAGGAEPQQKNHRRFLDLKESDGSVIVVIFLPWVAVFLRYADSLKLNFTSLQRWGLAFFPWALWTNVVDDDRDMQAWDNGGGNNRGRHLCFRLFHHAPWFWSFRRKWEPFFGRSLIQSFPFIFTLMDPYGYASELLPERNTSS